MQAFTWRAAAVFIVTGGGLYFYFQNEKKKIEERKRASILDLTLSKRTPARLTALPCPLRRFAGQEVAAQKVGRPKIGGPFKLTDQNGSEFTHEDLLGKHSLVYVSAVSTVCLAPRRWWTSFAEHWQDSLALQTARTSAQRSSTR